MVGSFMKNIFLAPRSNETSHKNFESTIVVGRPYSFFTSHLTTAEKTVLSAHKNIQVWGTKESLEGRWKEMKSGDYVLFYKQGAFYYSAEVLLTKFDLELSKKLWPVDKKGVPWPCLFFVHNVKEIHIPIRTLQELAGYKPSWDRVQGFMGLNTFGRTSIIEKFGSFEAFLKQDAIVHTAIDSLIEDRDSEEVQYEEYKIKDKALLLKEAQAYTYSKESHKMATAPHKVRLENRKQKRIVAELENHSCQVCGWKLEWKNKRNKTVYRIDVDHIKDKAGGGDESLENLWVLCPNCHTKKTCGVIVVDVKKRKVMENGKTIKLKHDHHLFIEDRSK